MHLKNTRVATTKRIKDEYERRRDKNREAIAVLEANSQLWNLVGGPCVEYLAEPSEEALDRAHEAKELLLKIRAQEDAPDTYRYEGRLQGSWSNFLVKLI